MTSRWLLLLFAAPLIAVACGGPVETPGPAPVDVVADDLTDAAEPDDDLSPDPEPMITDTEVDAIEARDLDLQEADAAAEIDLPDVAADHAEGFSGGTAAVRCKKRIHVTFAVYTFLTDAIRTNGCWTPERTTQDADFRDGHSSGDVKHASGTRWFYDDTNPRNDLGRERAVLSTCRKGATRGYEYMAFRDGRWRLVREPHAVYFAELYTDDAHLSDLYYAPGVYRGNPTLRANRRVYPMLNFAPYPDGRYSEKRIATEILKLCKTVRNHGYIGLYEWHFPLPHDSARLRNVERALDRCTRR